MSAFGTALVILAGSALYFVPSAVAAARRQRNFAAIVVLNIFLGWTGLGWVIALVWACMVSGQMPADNGMA